jgi:formyltetrahydrofolate-dependent phosphoribosylglycinamide formyltransferase
LTGPATRRATRRRAAILLSGRGSNAQALLQAAAAEGYPAEFVLVLANRADAAGLDRAACFGVPTRVVESRRFGTDRAEFEATMEVELAAFGVEVVALAGFMRVLTAGFVQRWQGRLVNIHPSLLPAFPGLDTHARALAAGVSLHGCTVHMVTSGVDQGPILAQAAVPVLPGDTADRLAARVLAQEHRIYPPAFGWVAAGRVSLIGDRTAIRASASPTEDAALLNPLPILGAVPRDGTT